MKMHNTFTKAIFFASLLPNTCFPQASGGDHSIFSLAAELPSKSLKEGVDTKSPIDSLPSVFQVVPADDLAYQGETLHVAMSPSAGDPAACVESNTPLVFAVRDILTAASSVKFSFEIPKPQTVLPANTTMFSSCDAERDNIPIASDPRNTGFNMVGITPIDWQREPIQGQYCCNYRMFCCISTNLMLMTEMIVPQRLDELGVAEH